MTKEKREAMMIMLFIYNEFHNPIKMNGDTTQDMPSKPVSKLLRQIDKRRLHLARTNPDVYEELRVKINAAKIKTIDEVVKPLKASYIAAKEDILTMFWDSLNRNPYQQVWIKESTIMGAVNSLSQVQGRLTADEDLARENGREIVRSFLDHLGMKKNPLLSRLKFNAENDLILEGKI